MNDELSDLLKKWRSLEENWTFAEWEKTKQYNDIDWKKQITPYISPSVKPSSIKPIPSPPVKSSSPPIPSVNRLLEGQLVAFTSLDALIKSCFSKAKFSDFTSRTLLKNTSVYPIYVRQWNSDDRSIFTTFRGKQQVLESDYAVTHTDCFDATNSNQIFTQAGIVSSMPTEFTMIKFTSPIHDGESLTIGFFVTTDSLRLML